MRNFFKIFFILPLFFLVACDDKNTSAPPLPPEVGVITIQPQDVDIKTELSGRTSAFRMAEVRPQVSGIIVKRLFVEGSDIKEGDPLYQIDPAPYQAAVDSAAADLAKAKANVQSAKALAGRYASLVKINAVSKQEHDDAMATLAQNQAQVSVAKAALTVAEINLNYTRVFSPISGRIGKSQITEGGLVTANQAMALTSVTQLDPIYVDVTQSSSDMMRLRQTMEKQAKNNVQFAMDGAGKLKIVTDLVAVDNVQLTMDGVGQPYPQLGKLQFSDVTVDQATGSVQLRALFPNEDGILLPGLFVRATITQGVQEGAFLVPQQALIRSANGQTFVWAIGSNKEGGIVANQMPVRVSNAVGKYWLLSADDPGLKGGEQLVTQGLQKLMRSGTVVRVTPLDDPPSDDDSDISSPQ